MGKTWKAVELRLCRLWGGERRGPLGRECSDCVETPVALEIKYSKRRVPEGRWIEQAVGHSVKEGKPWVLVVCGHHDRKPIAVCDHAWLLELARKAGVLA